MKWATIAPDGQTICLRKFNGEFSFINGKQNPKENTTRGLAIDTETTGLVSGRDEIIEIACREFNFDAKTGQITDVLQYYEGRQQPSEPLKKETTIITGLTDEDLRGQSIDWGTVNKMMDNAKLVLAHNAGFDRPFVDKDSETSRTKIWGCTSEQIAWMEKHGYPTRKLENLSYYHGFFTDAHRALNDVNAMLYILTMQNYLQEILEDTRRPRIKLLAFDSPFKSKDILKDRGYSWDPARKTWWATIPEPELEAEIEFLERHIYINRFPGKTIKMKPSDRFKEA